MQEPADQLRGKANRLIALKKLEKKLRGELKSGSVKEAELEDELLAEAAKHDEIRTRINAAIAEQVQLNEEQLVLLQAPPPVQPNVSSVIATIQADIEGNLKKEGTPQEAIDRKDEMLSACTEAGAILQKLLLFQEALRKVGVGGGQSTGAEAEAATQSPVQGEGGPPTQSTAAAIQVDANATGEGTATATPTAPTATAAANGVKVLQEGPKRVSDISDDDLLKVRTKFRKSPYWKV